MAENLVDVSISKEMEISFRLCDECYCFTSFTRC